MAEARLSGILDSLSGTLGNFVFRVTRNGIVVADRPPDRNIPPSPDQRLTRAFFTEASRAWSTLTTAQRTGWETYAGVYFLRDRDRNGAGPSGQAVFNKCAWYQLAAGLPIPADAPSAPPPLPVTGATLDATSDEEELVFNLSHGVGAVAGHLVFVETTPVLASAARQPTENDYRAIAGLGASSLPALVASGAPVRISDTRFVYPVGGRFGARFTIVGPGGVPSSTAFTGVYARTQ